MSINFCNAPYRPRIHCDQVSSDSYEVENLVSEDWMAKHRGFLAAHFIKPPVTVTVEFPCNIDIQCIIVNPVVGAQKSTGVEIYTHSEMKSSTWLKDEFDSSKVDNIPATVDGIFSKVGSCLQTQPNVFYFVNRRFRHRPPFANSSTEHNLSNDCVTSEIKHHYPSALSRVSHIGVRIFRTAGGCVPGIKKLEVWGQPAASCSKDIIQIIQNIYQKQMQQFESSNIRSHDHIKRTDSSETEPDTSSMNTTNIPEEFLDPITCHIMSLPVLLPSGHTVDQSTLDKYNATEHQWGRLPSDPFTGCIFNQGSGPVPNIALKARIDQYLVKHEVGSLLAGQTVGRFKDVHNSHIGALLNSSSELPSSKMSAASNLTEHSQGTSELGSRSQLLTKTKHVNKSSVASHSLPVGVFRQNKRPGNKPGIVSAKRIKPTVEAPSLPSFLTQSSSSSTSEQAVTRAQHEQQLETSLNNAINDALKTFPSFSKPLVSNDAANSTQCTECNRKLDTSAVCYQLPCTHLMCRDCVVAKKRNVKCNTCSKSFQSNDIVRKHW